MPTSVLPASDLRLAWKRDGFVVLPELLPAELIARGIEDAERLLDGPRQPNRSPAVVGEAEMGSP